MHYKHKKGVDKEQESGDIIQHAESPESCLWGEQPGCLETDGQVTRKIEWKGRKSPTAV